MHKSQQKPTDEPSQTTSADTSTEAATEGSQCPLCQFIEAGACKEQHQAWAACREAAKKEGIDYVDACHEQFKVFIQCTLDNADYYEPFLSTLLGDEEDKYAEEGTPPDDNKQGSQDDK